MGKCRSSPSGRKKNHLRQHGAELPYSIAARPPQECWSVRDCTNFKIALGRFGQDWQKVAEFIGTKTADQISVYAEEYFLKSKTHVPANNVPSPQVYGFSRKNSLGYKQQEQSISSTGLSEGNKDESPPMFIKSSSSSSPEISTKSRILQ